MPFKQCTWRPGKKQSKRQIPPYSRLMLFWGWRHPNSCVTTYNIHLKQLSLFWGTLWLNMVLYVPTYEDGGSKFAYRKEEKRKRTGREKEGKRKRKGREKEEDRKSNGKGKEGEGKRKGRRKEEARKRKGRAKKEESKTKEIGSKKERKRKKRGKKRKGRVGRGIKEERMRNEKEKNNDGTLVIPGRKGWKGLSLVWHYFLNKWVSLRYREG